MSRDFNGTTDRIDYTNVMDLAGNPFTISALVYADSGTIGYVFDASDSGNTFGAVFRLINTMGLDIFRRGSPNSTFRTSNNSVITANTWTHILCTAEDDLDNTNMHIYVSNSEVGYSDSNNGSNQTATTGTWAAGGRPNDDNRNFGGFIAELASWNRILSAEERAGLAAGYSPLFYRRNLIFYPDFIRSYRDRITGKSGTLDGTGIADHPRVIYPSSRFVISVPIIIGETLSQVTLDADGTIAANVRHDAGTGSPFYTHCNDAPDGLSSDYVENDDAETTTTAWFRLTDVDSDFSSMNSLNIDVDVAVTQGGGDDTCKLNAQIFDSNLGGSENPLTNSKEIGSETDTTRTQRNVVFGSLTGSKAQWNGAYIKFTWTYVKTASPDNMNVQIYGCDLDGVYTSGAGVDIRNHIILAYMRGNE